MLFGILTHFRKTLDTYVTFVQLLIYEAQTYVYILLIANSLTSSFSGFNYKVYQRGYKRKILIICHFHKDTRMRH